MFLDRILNTGSAPLIERMVQFTGARHAVLAENIANSTTPGYQQKDLSLPAFQKALGRRIEERETSAPGAVSFDDMTGEVTSPTGGIMFHDRNSRSMETLMSDMASNALKHNMYTEMLRKQYDTVEMVLKDHVA
jgi:flagellar basal-body rod protein FlgB